MDPFYTIIGDSGRLLINLYEVVAFEEVYEKEKPHRKMVMFYMRNGSSFTVPDPERLIIDGITNKLRGYGGENEYAQSE